MHLRQSTASQSVVIGPFVDSADAVTPESALVIANTDIGLSKNGGNIVSKNSGGGTYDEAGMYTITLDAADTDTVGRLQLICNMSGALGVYHEFEVLEEAVYDALYAASAPGPLPANSNGSGLTEAGGTGDHLTAVPWNAAWDAEVQSECADAISAYDPPTHAEMISEIAGLNDISAAEVNAQVVDALSTDTYAEPGQGLPPATASIAGKVGYLYKWARNRKDNDGAQNRFYADDGSTVDQIQTTSEDGGVVTVGEMESGA